jgi:CBS domain containing-hemolysin-like protein/mannitol/fructose-specific phosphotransferase system IIA component (Ntr-type)
MNVAVALLIVALLLLLNAFFVLAEFAIVKVRGSRVEELLNEGHRTAAILKSITDHMDGYLSAIQLGITMTSLGLGWVGEPALASLIRRGFQGLPSEWAFRTSHTLAFAIAFSLITFLHVSLGELTPKSIAIRFPTRAALVSAYPLKWMYRLFYGPMLILNFASNLLLKLFGLSQASEGEGGHSDQELRILLSQSQERGRMPLARLLLFENLFDFGQTVVKEVMTPASEIAYLSTEKPWAETLAMVEQRRYSRYPLVEGNDLRQARGVVHVKDILLAARRGIPDLMALRRGILWINDTTPLDKALDPLRSRHLNMALVKNRQGDVVGLITLEDVLEELVGEIQDEFSPMRSHLFSDVLYPETMDLALPAGDKETVYRGLLRKVCEARPQVDFERTWRALWTREQSLSSALGRQIAIPHARLPNIEKAIIALGRPVKPLDFVTPDKKPVRLIFMILTPQNQPGVQLRFLAKVAAVASNRTIFRNLTRAKTPKDVLDVLATFDQTMTD